VSVGDSKNMKISKEYLKAL